MYGITRCYGVSLVYCLVPMLVTVFAHIVLCCVPGECISGALEWKELMKLSTEIGFAPPVLVGVTPVTIDTPELKEVVGKSYCVRHILQGMFYFINII